MVHQQPMGSQDVIIVGAGVVGLTLAHGLKAVRSNATTLFEQMADSMTGWNSIPDI